LYTFSRENQRSALSRAAQLTKSEGWMPDAWALTVLKGSEIEGLIPCAVIVCQNITTTGADIHLSMIDDQRPTKRMMQGVYKFLLHPSLMNYETLRAFIPEENISAQVAAIQTGFEIEARLRGFAYGGSDAILLTMKRARCRWFVPKGD